LRREELYNVLYSPNVIRIMESRMRWTGRVARALGEEKNTYGVLVEKP
jgi:hypothetical protein